MLIFLLSLNHALALSLKRSRIKRDHVCEANRNPGSFGPDVNRTARHARDGEIGHEGRQSAVLFLRPYLVTNKAPRRIIDAPRAQVYRQRHVQLHECNVFGVDACSRDCRHYRTEQSETLENSSIRWIYFQTRVIAIHVAPRPSPSLTRRRNGERGLYTRIQTLSCR